MILDLLLETILPRLCVVCEKKGVYPQWFCASCRKDILFVPHPQCERCGYPLSEQLCSVCLTHPKKNTFDFHRSLFLYEGVASDLIARYKFGKKRELALCFGNLFCEYHPYIEGNFILPIPLFKSRLRKRVFNQSLEMARVISKIKKTPLLDGLIKLKSTQPQTELSRQERLHNLRNIFVWKGKSLVGEKIILIDDVLSTGATMAEAARTLKTAGAKQVMAYTVCLNVLTPSPKPLSLRERGG